MTGPSGSLIVVLVSRFVAKLIQLFALYVVFHGHYSPGGGFQGGALLAASVLLLRMANGRDATQANYPSEHGLGFGALGALAFLGIGLATLTGGNFLNYAHTPLLPLEPAELRSMSILIVEAAIAVAVMGTLVSIFDNLSDDTDS